MQTIEMNRRGFLDNIVKSAMAAGIIGGTAKADEGTGPEIVITNYFDTGIQGKGVALNDDTALVVSSGPVKGFNIYTGEQTIDWGTPTSGTWGASYNTQTPDFEVVAPGNVYGRHPGGGWTPIVGNSQLLNVRGMADAGDHRYILFDWGQLLGVNEKGTHDVETIANIPGLGVAGGVVSSPVEID